MPFLDHVLHPFKHTHKEPVGETPFGPLAARRAAAGRGSKDATMASDFTTTSATSTARSGVTTSSSTTISDTTMTPVDLSYPASDTGDDASENFRHHDRQRDVDVVEPLHNFHQTKKFEGSEHHHHHHHHGEPRVRQEGIGSLGAQDQNLIEFTPKGVEARTNFDAEDLRRGNLPRDQSILDVENTIPPSGMHALAESTEEVKVVLPGTEEQVIVKQVQGPEVTIHQTHIEQPMVHEQHIHKDIVHEHHIVQDVIHERHIEQPIITEKHIEKPVVHEKHIERPIIHEKHYEKEVIHEKHIEQPIIHERHIDKPVMHEQHIVVPIIHEQHIIKPIIHEVHVTQVVTDLVLPTQTSQAQMSAAIAEAASAAIAQAGNSTEPIHIMAPPIVRTADSIATETALSTAAVLQTDATQPPPVASQVFDTAAPLVFPPGDMSTSSEAAAAVQAACAVPIGAPATTVISRGNVGGVLPASGSIEGTSEGSSSGSPDVVLTHEEKKASKKDKKKKSRFHNFFHKH